MSKIELDHVAGYATERTVWKMIFDLATGRPNELLGSHVEVADAWEIGHTAFYALMGTRIFHGLQDSHRPIPSIPPHRCSKALSDLIQRCLSHEDGRRPSLDDIAREAESVLSMPLEMPRRLVRGSGGRYKESLVRFWPEEMARVALTVLFVLCCGIARSQGVVDVSREMEALVGRCVELRGRGDRDRVEREFLHDRRWTVMDELEGGGEGECRRGERVRRLGLNEMMYRLALRRRGVSNARGRFRNGQDERYEYSLLEVAARGGARLEYVVPGRSGRQVFAVVPGVADAEYGVSVAVNGVVVGEGSMRDGVMYVETSVAIGGEDMLVLTITNRSRRNMAFVIINHNTRKGVER